eukprot:6185383-Amphidinium_carterae.1
MLVTESPQTSAMQLERILQSNRQMTSKLWIGIWGVRWHFNLSLACTSDSVAFWPVIRIKLHLL